MSFTLSYYFKEYKATDKEIENAIILLERVNSLLYEYQSITKIDFPFIATSTIRTKEHNDKIGGAKSSLHLTAEAIDIADSDGKLGKFLLQNQEFLEKYKLSLESPTKTKGWAHLDTKQRTGQYRVFNP